VKEIKIEGKEKFRKKIASAAEGGGDDGEEPTKTEGRQLQVHPYENVHVTPHTAFPQ